MEERRAVSHILRHLRDDSNEEAAIEVDALAKTLTLKKKRKAFKKKPDEPLGVVMKRKLAKRRRT